MTEEQHTQPRTHLASLRCQFIGLMHADYNGPNVRDCRLESMEHAYHLIAFNFKSTPDVTAKQLSGLSLSTFCSTPLRIPHTTATHRTPRRRRRRRQPSYSFNPKSLKRGDNRG
jgi:hypothetical protein